MRTNIEIDDKLMKKALKASRLEKKTKRAVVEEALQLLVQIRAQQSLRDMFGKRLLRDDYDPKTMSKDKWAEAEPLQSLPVKAKSTARPRRKLAA